MTPEGDLETVAELVLAISDQLTAGYDVEYVVQPRRERYRAGDSFWLVILVDSNAPSGDAYPNVRGEWWFDADAKVMQVL